MADRIIGIDFGTSTSVIRVRRYQNGNPVDVVPNAVTFNNGSPMVPTLIQKLANGAVTYYGYEAEVPKRAAAVYQNFKLELESPDPEKRAAARWFGEINFDKIKTDPERVVSLINPQETVALGLVYKNIPLVFPSPDPKPMPIPVWPTDANEQYKLAQAYEDGQGVPQNSKWAFNLYKMAAEQGHPQAQYQLGICLREGRGIERNSQEAIKWLLKAKKNGITIAGVALSKMDPDYIAEIEVRVAKENLNNATYQLKDSFKTSMEELKDIWEAGIKSFKSGWNEGKNIFGDNKK